MRIAVDGGAFQRAEANEFVHIAVGLLNGLSKTYESFSYILILDPLLGPVNLDLIARLDVEPQLVYCRSRSRRNAKLKISKTQDPDFRFDVDGRVSRPRIEGTRYIYEGPAPNSYFAICSRADRPIDVTDIPDSRRLGVSIRSLDVECDGQRVPFALDDPSLGIGFHDFEGDHRWTDGYAYLPVHLFDGFAGVKVIVDVGAASTYLVGVIDTSAADTASQGPQTNCLDDFESKALDRFFQDQAIDYFVCNSHIYPELQSTKTIILASAPCVRQNPSERLSAAKIFAASHHVFTFSETSRKSHIKHYGLVPEKVSTLPFQVDYLLWRDRIELSRVHAAVAKVIQKPFILCIGPTRVDKNHIGLVEACAGILHPRKKSADLVFFTKGDSVSAELLYHVRTLGLEESVTFIDSVGKEEVSALYAHALCLAYPSFYEEFSLPILEAMACGCPVLASNTSSMAELAADAGCLVEPRNHESILRGVQSLIYDPRLRRSLAARGLERHARLTWIEAARKLVSQLYPPHVT